MIALTIACVSLAGLVILLEVNVGMLKRTIVQQRRTIAEQARTSRYWQGMATGNVIFEPYQPDGVTIVFDNDRTIN